MAKLTLKDVVDHVAAATGESKKNVEGLLKQSFDYINTNVHAGNEVRIHEFGTFSRKDSPERTGRNPATGESIQIAAKQTLVFKAVKHK